MDWLGQLSKAKGVTMDIAIVVALVMFIGAFLLFIYWYTNQRQY